MATENLKTASVLAFERKLDPSDARLYAGRWTERGASDRWPGVRIQSKSVRGTISNRLKTKDQDPAKLDAAIENPNLQTVDVAALPHDTDTLKAQFTLRVLGGTGKPSACNEPAYQKQLQQTVGGYVQTHGFGELARRYAHNLANARWLWRNRIGAEQVEVHISRLVDGQPAKTWTFEQTLALSLRNFAAAGPAQTALGELADVIRNGLESREHVLLRVTAYARMGAGQEIYPSQELILDRSSDKSKKSKTLYHVDGVAGIHSQKIGNAVRTIDDWYPQASELGPIAVEPYGSVTTQGKAYRQSKEKADFYTLLDNWMLKGKAPDEGNQHYVMAVLIRGGVFGEAKE